MQNGDINFPGNFRYQPRRALVLSGGGARGAYQVGVIKYLCEHGWIPDLVCGTSIGAVNAAALSSGMSPVDLEKFWLAYDKKKIRRFSLRRLLNSLKSRRIYLPPGDIRGVRALLEREIDLGALRKSDMRILISAINMKTGSVRYFENEVIGIQHILAAIAIPMVFPWQYIDGEPHWDAGLIANTPIGPALALNAEEIVVVLHSPVGAFQTPEPGSAKQVFELAVEHGLAGSYTAIVGQASWRPCPGNGILEPPSPASAAAELAGRGIHLHTVAPTRMPKIQSLFNYSASQAKELIRAGYMNAGMQLGRLSCRDVPA